jgi:hypothetical protein
MCSALKEVKVFNINITAFRVRKTTMVWKTTRVRKTTRSIKNYKTTRSPRNQEIQEVCKSQESPQESKKTAKSQESRTSRVWKTGRIQEPRSMRITPNNIAIFPPARGGEREKGKRYSSLKSMVKSSDDSSFLKLHP